MLTTRTPQAPKRRPHDRVTYQSGQMVHVHLTGGSIAVLDAADFDRIDALGFSIRYLNRDGRRNVYVKATPPGSTHMPIMAAQLVLDVPPGQVVRYADRNPLNLRKANLVLDVGFSKRREKAEQARADDEAF